MVKLSGSENKKYSEYFEWDHIWQTVRVKQVAIEEHQGRELGVQWLHYL